MACVPAIDFLHDDDIKTYFIRINPLFKLTDIPSFVRSAAAEQIELRTDTIYEIKSEILFVDGIGANCVQSTRLPIVSLSAIAIILDNLEETDLVLGNSGVATTDVNRNVDWDSDTGVIKLLSNFNLSLAKGITSNVSEPIFPRGIGNVKLTGVFGTTCPLFLLKLIQLLLMAKTMQSMDTKRYPYDAIKEKIGRYEYTLRQGFSANGRETIDSYTDHLFSLLPKENTFVLEAL